MLRQANVGRMRLIFYLLLLWNTCDLTVYLENPNDDVTESPTSFIGLWYLYSTVEKYQIIFNVTKWRADEWIYQVYNDIILSFTIFFFDRNWKISFIVARIRVTLGRNDYVFTLWRHVDDGNEDDEKDLRGRWTFRGIVVSRSRPSSLIDC